MTKTSGLAQQQKPRRRRFSAWVSSEIADGLKLGTLIAFAVLAVALPPQLVSSNRTASGAESIGASPAGTTLPRFADFSGEAASPDARFIANWVADSSDNRNMDFVVIDKRHTRIYVFDANAKLLGATPVLLGVAPGDDSVVGIGQRPMDEVKPQERTTPAGRFIGEPGRNTTGENVVWVDYESAVSMHRVRAVDPKERRLERLATPATDDNRISYGCVNVPVSFFENVLSPVFHQRHGVVYVLPEIKTLSEVFPRAYDPIGKREAFAATPSIALRAGIRN